MMAGLKASKDRNELRNVSREFELAEKKVAAWLIMNDKASQHKTARADRPGKAARTEHDVIGKIIVRYTKKASIVSVLFYAIDNAPAIGTTETMTGCGYDRTVEGISTVLWRLRDELYKWHGIRFDCSETAMMRIWEQELKKSGYTAIRVL